MRVSMSYNAVPTCQSFTYGEVEDYTLTIENASADTTAPVLALNGATNIDLNVGDTYNEQGATASDNIDGNLTNAIVITENIDTNTAGIYTVNYNVSDAAGNAATQVSRTVIVNEVVIDGCANGVNTFPYTEGFEGNIGAWSQSSEDDINWTVLSGATPSSGTGPNAAIEGSSYLYVEASGDGTGYPNKRAVITSPCYDLSAENEANFSFSYHMFGAENMGTISLEVSTNNGVN